MILVLSILFDALARMIERRTAIWQTAGRREKEVPEPAGLPAPAVV